MTPGQRIAKDRAYVDLALPDCAERAAIPVARLEAIEDERVEPTRDELEGLARALGFPPTHFYRPQLPFDEPPAPGFLRQLASVTAEDRAEIQAFREYLRDSRGCP